MEHKNGELWCHSKAVVKGGCSHPVGDLRLQEVADRHAFYGLWLQNSPDGNYVWEIAIVMLMSIDAWNIMIT